MINQAVINLHPLVSVCIPVFNGGRFLRESIECVLNQSYTNIELLIVDDQSTDDSFKIAKEYLKIDERIRLIKNEKSEGMVSNWNKCLSKSEGVYVKLHFQDDLMDDFAIEKMVNFLLANDVSLVLSDRKYRFEEDDYSEGKKRFFEGLPKLSDRYDQSTIISSDEMVNLLFDLGLQSNFLGEPILGLIRKDLIEEIGDFDDQFDQIMDFEYWLRVALNDPIGYLPESLHDFRVHGLSESSRNSRSKGVNRSRLDRIKLAVKIAEHPGYEKLRRGVWGEKLSTFIHKEVTHYIISIGYRNVKSEMGATPFHYFDESYLNTFKACINDLARIF